MFQNNILAKLAHFIIFDMQISKASKWSTFFKFSTNFAEIQDLLHAFCHLIHNL